MTTQLTTETFKTKVKLLKVLDSLERAEAWSFAKARQANEMDLWQIADEHMAEARMFRQQADETVCHIAHLEHLLSNERTNDETIEERVRTDYEREQQEEQV